MILSALLSILSSPALPAPPVAPAQEPLTLTAERVHLGDGRVLEGATVTLDGGKVVAVTPAPDAAATVPGAVLTPGLVDPYCFLGVGAATVEESREVTPAARVVDGARLDDPALANAWEWGVTTAYLSPDSLSVIGGLGAVVKTAGGEPADLFAADGAAMRVLEPEAGLRVAISVDSFFDNFTPSGRFTNSYHARRPNTRMGSVWLVREAFYAAQAYREARAADPEVAEDPELEVLVAALEGRVPVRFLARRAHDVQTALRLKDEFGWPRLVIEEAAESYLVPELLAETDGVAVVCGPLADARARVLATGPRREAMAEALDPPEICCEDQEVHDPYLAHAEVGDLSGTLHDPPAFLADVLLATLPRYGFASGFAAGRVREAERSTPASPGLLAAHGVPVFLAAGEGYGAADTEAGLMAQARTAVRWGLPLERAVPMVTHDAAELLGVGDRVGLLAPGYDADLVLWSGDPLDPASRPLLVVVDGRVVLDRRSQD